MFKLTMNKLEILSDNQDTVCNTFVGDTLNDCMTVPWFPWWRWGMLMQCNSVKMATLIDTTS